MIRWLASGLALGGDQQTYIMLFHFHFGIVGGGVCSLTVGTYAYLSSWTPPRSTAVNLCFSLHPQSPKKLLGSRRGGRARDAHENREVGVCGPGALSMGEQSGHASLCIGEEASWSGHGGGGGGDLAWRAKPSSCRLPPSQTSSCALRAGPAESCAPHHR